MVCLESFGKILLKFKDKIKKFKFNLKIYGTSAICELPKTMTSASFSAVPELFFNTKVYFPLSFLTARRIVSNVLRSYLSIVILKLINYYIKYFIM